MFKVIRAYTSTTGCRLRPSLRIFRHSHPYQGLVLQKNVCTFIARNRAVSYVDRFDDKSPKEAHGMFRSMTPRV